MIDAPIPLGFLDTFVGAFDFILHEREGGGGNPIGGPADFLRLTWAQIEVSAVAMAGSLAIALPVGAWFGHLGRGEFLAIGFGNAGRAIPELAVIVLLASIIGIGLENVAVALMVLGVPPILTNTFVGVHQVDQRTVEAARGMGMSETGVLFRIELPLAVPTIMSGVRTAAINIIATATIASIVGFSTLGDYIFGQNTYGTEGVVAGAIVVALLALTAELLLAGLQSLLTSPGLKLQRAREGA